MKIVHTRIPYALMLALSIGISGGSLAAQEIATCKNPVGQAYYPHRYPIPKNKSGWTNDAITDGITTIRRLSSGEYDILFFDATKQIISTVADGGVVVRIKRSNNDVLFVVLYAQSGVLETYHLFKDEGGNNQYTHFKDSGASSPTALTKSSLMVGECSQINFNLID